MKLDFYASQPHYLDHMKPIWDNLNSKFKGKFIITENIEEYAKLLKLNYCIEEPREVITLVSSYGDYKNTKKEVIFMEHGIGFTFSNNHPSYAGGKGKDRVVLFLNQHTITQIKNQKAYPLSKQEIIGVPKTDQYINLIPVPKDKPTICLSFHWNCKVSPETTSAFSHYASVIPKLNKNKEFNLVFHGHPHDNKKWEKYCTKNNIKRIKTFDEVIKTADVYVADATSTSYEFAVTGKPVIILNAPWYRKNIHHGIRFWDYIPGPQVDDPKRLELMMLRAVRNPRQWDYIREPVIDKLYPYFGESAKRAATVIENFLINQEETTLEK